jgi:peptide/nickel transport system ATP-binding protein
MTALLDISALAVTFKTPEKTWTAIPGVNLSVGAGEVVGLVGETGCGKTLTGLSVLRLLPQTARITGGDITYRGASLLGKSEAEMRSVRGADIAMVFQNPTSAFNPVHTIARQMKLVLETHTKLSKKDSKERIRESLGAAGLPEVDRVARSYPHQLSGGMLQRAMIAMALLCKPALLIADEPTTALDVTIAAQVLELIRKLQADYGFSVLYITHDLGVVRAICDRVVVLYAGRDVETAPTNELFDKPTHPYTRALLAAVPRAVARGQQLPTISGIVPSDPGDIKGCAFAPRCPMAFDRCFMERPTGTAVSNEHSAACHLAESYDISGLAAARARSPALRGNPASEARQ